MTSFALLAVLAAILSLLAASLRIHRFSRGHLTVELTMACRGLYVSKTPDGVWWAVRMRRRNCLSASWWPDDDPPQPSGVREPRHPTGPAPLAAADAVDPRPSD